jgi:hypothetical protein
MQDMKYFIPNDTFDNAIKNKEKGVLKALMIGIIGSDPTFATTEYAEATDYVINRFRSYTHPEISISKPLRAVSVSYGENLTETLSVDAQGEVQTVSNSFIKTAADAQRVARSTAEVLKGRKTISGEYRADPRLNALDVISVESKYADNTVVITDITYSTSGGAFKGIYSGRIVPMLPTLATGGFVNEGQMFLAHEAGPELVGSINGRTSVG